MKLQMQMNLKNNSDEETLPASIMQIPYDGDRSNHIGIHKQWCREHDIEIKVLDFVFQKRNHISYYFADQDESTMVLFRLRFD